MSLQFLTSSFSPISFPLPPLFSVLFCPRSDFLQCYEKNTDCKVRAASKPVAIFAITEKKSYLKFPQCLDDVPNVQSGCHNFRHARVVIVDARLVEGGFLTCISTVNLADIVFPLHWSFLLDSHRQGRV